jgi:RNA polymerase sigma factor (sigma-70 family)
MAVPVDAGEFTQPHEQLRLFREHQDELRNYFRRVVRIGALDQVDDLMQMTYLALQKSRPREPVRDPKGYLFGIAHNVLLHSDRQLKRQRDRFLSLDEPVRDARGELADHESSGALEPAALQVADEAESGSDHTLQAKIWQALRTLPETWQVTFIFAYQEQLTYKEIAARLGVGENTVKKNLKKTLARLRQHLKAQLQEQPPAKDRS